ncbi:unnamed protein product [Rotaria sp. Silwood2]|nr:unnamed protein product [Rotaria sp. Silwood2]CAF3076422.1 unnamed protein product [Rotaria sp. Silwood2]CAF3408559.1 unnamed protein product [Rotaria sp. Silwood2]CAF4330110.1 unnamed protein product [Rotaria sp. Silwood2]CAF4377067.1 unnamed protein product [Rotaria sp. Silwood2]
MIYLYTILYIILSLLIVHKGNGISSLLQLYTTDRYSIELQHNTTDLWWTVDESQQEITFELHVKTTRWIALAGGMKGADIGLGWDRYANGFSQPIIDNWTSIQFKRSLDTCDQMDIPIKSGTNTLIFAYSLEDPDMSQPNGSTYYHDNRRGSRIVPLRSYGNPSTEEKFADLNHIEYKLNNVGYSISE